MNRPPSSHGLVFDELRLDGVRVADVAHPPFAILPKHSHDSAKLWLVVSGRSTERCGVDVLTPDRFEPVFRSAGAPHHNQYHASGARSLLVEIDPSDPRAQRALHGRAPDHDVACRLGARLARAFRAPRSSRTREVRSLVRAILDAFDSANTPRTPSWLEAAREVLANETDAPPTLRVLARMLRVHPVYLAQTFRAHWRITTRAFVRAHRVFRAVELIDRGVSLADAAARAGFADQSHMTRAVRQERGLTPGALRRRCEHSP
jgi:AraC family transcriptional regulator